MLIPICDFVEKNEGTQERSFAGRTANVRIVNASENVTFVRIHNLPMEVDIEQVKIEIRHWGKIKNCRMTNYLGAGDYLEGMFGVISVAVVLTEDIPEFGYIGPWLCKFSYAGQPITCHSCFRIGHVAKFCHEKQPFINKEFRIDGKKVVHANEVRISCETNEENRKSGNNEGTRKKIDKEGNGEEKGKEANEVRQKPEEVTLIANETNNITSPTITTETSDMIVSGKENVNNFKRGADNLLLSISEACEDNMTILSISTVSNDMIASEKENIVNFKRGGDNLSPSISEYCEETLEEEELDDTESESVNGLEMTDKSQDMFPELRHQKREKKRSQIKRKKLKPIIIQKRLAQYQMGKTEENHELWKIEI